MAVLTSYNESFHEVAKLTDPTKQAYCNKHGYHFLVRPAAAHYHPVWAKMHLMKEILPAYDWVFWMDADAFIMNQEIKIETIIDPAFDFFVSHDINGLNSGVFLAKNSEWTKGLFDAVLDEEKLYAGYLGEQISLRKVVYDLNWIASGKIKITPQRVFNSYFYDIYKMTYPEGNYQPGDFIVHLPGMQNNDRVAKINEVLKNG